MATPPDIADDIESYLSLHQHKSMLRCHHLRRVDDGKSTSSAGSL